MKKIIFLCLLTLACNNKKEDIAARQKEVLKQKAAVEKLLEATKDSSMPTAAELKQWDSLYHVQDSLDKVYNELQKEAMKH